jgi:pyruvate dehydrogenase complex dehydrogenase (E1) component
MPATEATDTDPIEMQEWLESLEAVVLGGGRLRGLGSESASNKYSQASRTIVVIDHHAAHIYSGLGAAG